MQTSTPSLLASILIAVVQAYRNSLSLLMLPSCRFTPTCSVYALKAIQRYGALRGASYAVRRMLRCRPGATFGLDQVG